MLYFLYGCCITHKKIRTLFYDFVEVAQHDDGGNETKVKTKDIKELLTYLGFSGSETYSLENLYTDEHLSEAALGYRKVSYNGEDKTIVAVIIRGTNGTIEEWSSNFYIGCLDDFDSLVDWRNIDNHAGFDIAANRIKDIVQMYVNANNLENDNLVYWITGHSRGGYETQGRRFVLKTENNHNKL